MVGLESHAAVALELAARGRRIDPHRGELGVAVAAARLRLHRDQQLRHQRRRLAAVIERPALQARTIARVQRVGGRREELDVLALRRARPGRSADRRCRWCARRARTRPRRKGRGARRRGTSWRRKEVRRQLRHGSHTSPGGRGVPPKFGQAIRTPYGAARQTERPRSASMGSTRGSRPRKARKAAIGSSVAPAEYTYRYRRSAVAGSNGSPASTNAE